MKLILAVSLMLISPLAFSAGKKERKPNQKAYTYSEEKKMGLPLCLERLSAFAQEKKYSLEMWQAADFYINNQSGRRVGNAYYSQDTCYIYLD